MPNFPASVRVPGTRLGVSTGCTHARTKRRPRRQKGVRSWCIVPLLLAGLLATGCMRFVDGAVRPAAGLTPHPLLGHAVKSVLLDNGELAKMLGQPFKADPNSAPHFGGLDELFEGNAAPRECAAVGIELPRSAFAGFDVRVVANETWWNAASYDDKPRVISVYENVVALPTAAAADALFDTFTEQWQHCAGTTVDMGDDYFTYAISDVSAANSVVAADVQVHGSTTVPNAHAVGLRVNCLVEAEVAFFGAGSERTSWDRKSTTIEIARRMMDNISDLS